MLFDTRVTNAPKSASDTSAAEPMAKPLPIAAVVLPAASSASVLSRTDDGSSTISAMPPALSEMGPYTSMARQVDRVDSMPSAAKATPYMPAARSDTKMMADRIMTGAIADW